MKKRIVWIDFIKIIACLLVVVLYSITIGLSEHTYTNGLWIYYLGVFAIPLFFMTNGYLQLGKINQYRYVFQKVFRIMIIVLFWGGLLYLVKWVIGDTVTNPFYEIFGSFLQKGGFPHFWFLGSILIIDLLLPLFQKLYQQQSFSFWVYFMMVLCVILDILFLILYHNYQFVLKNHIIQTFRLWTWFLYFLLGGYLRKNYDKVSNLDKKKLFSLTLFMIVCSVLYQCFFAYQNYGTMYCEAFYDSPIIIFTSILIFLSISKLVSNYKLFQHLSDLTMGVYIIHYSILRVVCKILPFLNNYLRVIHVIIVVILSFLVSYVISKIPKLNQMIKV